MQERYAGLKLYAKHLPSHTQTWSRADIILLTFISPCLSFSLFTPSFCSNYTSLADSRSPKDKLIVRKSAINQPKSRIQERDVPSIIPSLPIVPKDFFLSFFFCPLITFFDYSLAYEKMSIWLPILPSTIFTYCTWLPAPLHFAGVGIIVLTCTECKRSR